MQVTECEKYLETSKLFNNKQKEILKQRIKLIKDKLKIKTTEELVDFADNVIDVKTLRRWENGLVKPHPAKVFKFNEVISAKLGKDFHIEVSQYPLKKKTYIKIMRNIRANEYRAAVVFSEKASSEDRECLKSLYDSYWLCGKTGNIQQTIFLDAAINGLYCKYTLDTISCRLYLNLYDEHIAAISYGELIIPAKVFEGTFNGMLKTIEVLSKNKKNGVDDNYDNIIKLGDDFLNYYHGFYL
ncbi:MAG: hypothetical protein QNJ54_28580 [Prochloraceae cyanobacterium]|nr:hypothetical protein [Prochloraceae cyanobacterium]